MAREADALRGRRRVMPAWLGHSARGIIASVQPVGQLQPGVEAEISQLTDADAFNFLVVAAISLFGVWIMTIQSRDDDFEDAPPDSCALCGDTIDDWAGATYPGPKSRRSLGLEVGEAVCQRCVRRLGG